MDQSLAQQARYKAKNNTLSAIPETLKKPTEGKRTKEILKAKARELLDMLTKPIINRRENMRQLEQENLALEAEVEILQERNGKSKHTFEALQDYLKKGTKLKENYEKALEIFDMNAENLKKLQEGQMELWLILEQVKPAVKTMIGK